MENPVLSHRDAGRVAVDARAIVCHSKPDEKTSSPYTCVQQSFGPFFLSPPGLLSEVPTVFAAKDITSGFDMDKVVRLASERGVVLFSKSSCCLCYAVKILFQELGVTPTIHEIDQDPEGREMERALMRLGCNAPVPAVFIGGKLVGSTNEVMSLHLGGGLIPLVKPYQALC
ncbi:hypothetical protein V6N13_060968 [Hibiscus sabdariffa]|uniref:Glutaredoxin domain-containing protein n=1 Tax=Hibiscus sabdariffa TaxID=183260 RepID=A0ABR2AZN3_9ROSI